jgi:hypothetical protein
MSKGAEHGRFRSRYHTRYISISRAFSLLFFLPQLRFVSVQIKEIYANRFNEFECNDQWQYGQPRRAKRIFASSNQFFLAVLHSPRPESLLQGKSDISESLRTAVLPKARDLETNWSEYFREGSRCVNYDTWQSEERGNFTEHHQTRVQNGMT